MLFRSELTALLVATAVTPALAETRAMPDCRKNDVTACTQVIASSTSREEISSAYMLRGSAYDDRNQFVEAIADYQSSIKLTSKAEKKGWAYFQIGKDRAQLKQFAPASDAVKKAIQIYPAMAAPPDNMRHAARIGGAFYYIRALIEDALNQTDLARADWLLCAETAVLPMAELAHLHVDCLDEAGAHYNNAALDQSPDKTHFDLRLLALAAKQFTKALQLDANDAFAAHGLGLVDYRWAMSLTDGPEKVQRLQSARLHFEKAIALSPDDPDTVKQAKAMLERIAAGDAPSAPPASQAQAPKPPTRPPVVFPTIEELKNGKKP